MGLRLGERVWVGVRAEASGCVDVVQHVIYAVWVREELCQVESIAPDHIDHKLALPCVCCAGEEEVLDCFLLLIAGRAQQGAYKTHVVEVSL